MKHIFWLTHGVIAIGFGIIGFGVSHLTQSAGKMPSATTAVVSVEKNHSTNRTGKVLVPHSTSSPQTASASDTLQSTGIPNGSIEKTISEILSIQNDRQKNMKLSQLMDQLDTNGIRQLMNFTKGLTKKSDQQFLIHTLLARWAELNPREAIDYYKQNLKGMSGIRMGRDIPWSVLSVWAKSDPHELIQWALQQTGDEKKQALGIACQNLAEKDPTEALRMIQDYKLDGFGNMYSIFYQLALKDPKTTVERAMQLTGTQKTQALSGALNQWITTDFQGALKWIDSISNPFLKRTVLQSALSFHGQIENPKAIADYLTTCPPGIAQSLYGQLAGSWANKNPKEALSWVDTLPEGRGRNHALSSVVSQWIQQDFKEASEYVLQIPPGNAQNSALQTMGWTLSQMDPKATTEWILKLPEGQARQNVLTQVLNQWSQNDPQAAAHFAITQVKGENDWFMSGIASQWAQSDVKAALNWGNTITQPTIRSNFISQALRTWAETDPHAALSYAGQLAPEERDRSYTSIVNTWADYQPEKALQWSLNLPEGQSRDNMVADAVNNWARNSPITAGEWLNTLPAGKTRDAAVNRFVGSIQQDDPDAAAKWIDTISDANTKRQAAFQLAYQWTRRNPVEAKAWILNTSAIPQNQKDQLLKK